MYGAREYAELIPTGQYGRLYCTSGVHARGKTFRIQVLPKDEEAISNGPGNMCVNKDAVVVYGVIGGQPGWTEYYGWLHHGQWEEGFMSLVQAIAKERKMGKDEREEANIHRNLIEKERIEALLSNY